MRNEACLLIFPIFNSGQYTAVWYTAISMNNASSLHMAELTGKEPSSFQQLSKLIELKFISII